MKRPSFCLKLYICIISETIFWRLLNFRRLSFITTCPASAHARTTLPSNSRSLCWTSPHASGFRLYRAAPTGLHSPSLLSVRRSSSCIDHALIALPPSLKIGGEMNAVERKSAYWNAVMSCSSNRADLPQFHVCKQTAYESIETAPEAAWRRVTHMMPSQGFYAGASFHTLGCFDNFTSFSFLLRRWEDCADRIV